MKFSEYVNNKLSNDQADQLRNEILEGIALFMTNEDCKLEKSMRLAMVLEFGAIIAGFVLAGVKGDLMLNHTAAPGISPEEACEQLGDTFVTSIVNTEKEALATLIKQFKKDHDSEMQ